MSEIPDFGLIVLVVAGGVSLALYGRAITERLAIPSAALFLVAAAVVSDLVPRIHDEISFVTVERIGVVALIVILFEGGLDIGWSRFRSSAVPILSLGVLGTFASAALIAARRARALRPLLDHERDARSRARPDRSRGHVLGARRPRDPRPDGDDPEGRVGGERPGRDRADDRDDRARDERPRLLLDGRRGVRRRDGRRRRGRCGRRGAAAAADAARAAALARALPAAGRRRRRCDLRRRHARPRLRLPGGVRGRDPDRRPAGAAPARDRRVPRLDRQPRGDRDVRRARPHDRPDASCSTRTPGSRGSRSRRCSHSRSARSSSERCSSPSGSTGASGCS